MTSSLLFSRVLLTKLFTHCAPAVCRNSTRNMRILQFVKNDSHCIGVRDSQGQILNLSAFSPSLPNTVCAALEQGHDALLAEAARCRESSAERLSPDDVHLLPPITKPDKVVCIGLNYRDHCAEVGAQIPTEPVVFSKFSSTISQSGPMKIPQCTQKLDWEVELVVVIGKTARNVAESDAYDYVFGYTVANDISARDMVSSTKNGGQYLLAKALDNFCPLGADIVTKEEIADVHNLKTSTTVNDITRQSSNTNQIIFRVPQLIAYLSGLFTLLPGDIILTGTPGGVGAGMTPPVFIQPGDVVKVEIEKIGSVVNTFS